MYSEERIIQFIRENKFFYDNKHPKYKSVVMRDQKFAELSNELRIPVKKLKDRWRTLRDKYYKDLKAINAGNPPLKKWKWMDQLSFLSEGGSKYANIDSKVSKEEDYTVEQEFPLTDEEDAKSPNTFTDHFILEDEHTIHHCPKPPAKKFKTQVEEVESHSQKKPIQRILEHLSPKKTAVDYFYAGLAIQTRDANITGNEFVELQMELLRTFNEFLSTREKADGIYAELENL